MTQQVNLYKREAEEKRGPALLTLLLLGVFAALLVLYWQMIRSENLRMEAQVKQLRTNVATEGAAIATMKAALATRTDPARVAAELAAIKSRAVEAQEIVDRLNRGELGSLQGFSSHFGALAGIAEPGIWLTHVKIGSAGKALEVEGRSLQADSVLRYATEVNRRVTGLGASVTSLEMDPFIGPNNQTAVSFKLY